MFNLFIFSFQMLISIIYKSIKYTFTLILSINILHYSVSEIISEEKKLTSFAFILIYYLLIQYC